MAIFIGVQADRKDHREYFAAAERVRIQEIATALGATIIKDLPEDSVWGPK